MAEDLQEKQGDIIDDGFDEFGEEGNKKKGFFAQQTNIIIIIAVIVIAGMRPTLSSNLNIQSYFLV